MTSATQNANMNGMGVSVVSRNIRDAALLVQNGRTQQPQENGMKPSVPQQMRPQTQMHSQAQANMQQSNAVPSIRVSSANTPMPQQQSQAQPLSKQPPPFKVGAPMPVPSHNGSSMQRMSNQNGSVPNSAPGYQLTATHSAGLLRPNNMNGFGNNTGRNLTMQQNSSQLGPGANLSANNARQSTTASTNASQKSFLQQQVERFVQQQAVQQAGRPNEAPYIIPSSHSASSLPHPRAAIGNNIASVAGNGNGNGNGAANRQQLLGRGLDAKHLAPVSTRPERMSSQPSTPSAAGPGFVPGLAANSRTNFQPGAAQPPPQTHTHGQPNAAQVRLPMPAPASSVYAHGDNNNNVWSQPSSNTAPRPSNDSVSFSLVGSRHARTASTSGTSVPNGQVNSQQANSVAVANPHQLNSNTERNRPLIYAPRSVIADTYLKQEQRGDSKGQSQRFLDILNRIRAQQLAGGDGQLTGAPALLASARLSLNGAPLPDYNYVVDHVDKVHIRTNTPRNMHRRASITDSAEDVRRISDALVLALGDGQRLVPIVTPDFAVSLSAMANLAAGSDTEEGTSGSSKSEAQLTPNVYPYPHPQVVASSTSSASSGHQDDSMRPRSVLRSSSSNARRPPRKVKIDPLALLLDAALEGELEMVRKMCGQVADPSAPNDEGITALHNAVCAGHVEICRFLIESAGANVNAADADGWTPLHCAASCNSLDIVRLLVEHGACLGSTTTDEFETPLDKCEPDLTGVENSERDVVTVGDSDQVRLRTHNRRNETCRSYLLGIAARLGVANDGHVFALFNYTAAGPEELSIDFNEKLQVLRRPIDDDWWLVRNGEGREGYVPRTYLGLYPRLLK